MECYCGNEYGKYGMASSRGLSCNMSCPNNPNEICGAGNANSIYFTNWPSKIVFFLTLNYKYHF